MIGSTQRIHLHLVMRILAFLTFTSCSALSQLSSAISSSHQPDVVQGEKKCDEVSMTTIS